MIGISNSNYVKLSMCYFGFGDRLPVFALLTIPGSRRPKTKTPYTQLTIIKIAKFALATHHDKLNPTTLTY